VLERGRIRHDGGYLVRVQIQKPPTLVEESDSKQLDRKERGNCLWPVVYFGKLCGLWFGECAVGIHSAIKRWKANKSFEQSPKVRL
jgi:hypothetical protein